MNIIQYSIESSLGFRRVTVESGYAHVYINTQIRNIILPADNDTMRGTLTSIGASLIKGVL